jgi:hypothetical protein
MSEIITIRVPKNVKALMQESDINWSEDIRHYIESRAKSLRLHKLLKYMKPVKTTGKNQIDSTLLIREDRDSR